MNGNWKLLAAALACLLTIPQPILAATADDLRGRLLERVACEADEKQTYSLYVPSSYVRERRWPVIFCFDAMARGRMPVERLRAAAEKYGYIVAGSLNSRNGPWEANAAAAQAMMKDVSMHLSIDAKRVYTTGVSGGARVATAIAAAGAANGVIACAAGFPQTSEIPSPMPFVLFGTAGNEDFNYQEMMRLDRELEERHAAHRMVIFVGEHSWAPEEVMTEGVEWLELQAMRAGTRPKDQAFIDAQWAQRRAGVPAEPLLAHWRGLKSLAADFEGLVPAAAGAAREAQEIGASKALKDALKVERKLEDKETGLLTELGEAAVSSIGQKKKVAANVVREAESAPDPLVRQATKRAMASYHMMARETARSMFEEHRYSDSAELLEMAVMLYPKRAGTWYELARARGLSGDTKAALEALTTAVQEGYSDAAKAEADEAFKKLRGQPAFAALIVRMKAPKDEVVQMAAMKVSAVLASVELRMFYLPNAGGEVSGLSFLRVENVRPNSGAAQAGVAVGMEIVAIQGKRIRGLSEAELNDLMKLPVTDQLVLGVREPPAAEREIRIVARKPVATATPAK